MLHLFCKVACWVATFKGCEEYQSCVPRKSKRLQAIFCETQDLHMFRLFTPSLSGKHLSAPRSYPTMRQSA